MSESTACVAAALSDRYRIERELGAGGMATVFLAHDGVDEALTITRQTASALDYAIARA